MSLWIDLTDFLQWKGNLTGIQRIQYNISKHYIEAKKDVKFFVYQEPNRSFVEVPFVPEEIVKLGIVDAVSKADEGTPLYTKQLARIARKIRSLTSQRLPESTEVTEVSAPFIQGDTILVMGGIWVGTFIDDLLTCKTRQGLIFAHFAFDMIPTLFPGYVVDWLPKAFGDYQEKVFGAAEGILAISESTKKDVELFISDRAITNSPRLTTVRIGETIDGVAESKPSRPSSLPELNSRDFILSVSTFEVRKNHAALFYALKEARRRGIQLPKIVIVGREGWQTNDIRYVMRHDPEASEGIEVLHGVDDKELVWLYENCRFTVFPSFYEGWGMPIAESLAYGKMCLASNTSSMPEIAGDLIEYFSPFNTGELLETILKYLDEGTLAAKERQIKESFTATTWKQMYEQIESFVDSLRT